MFSKLQSYWDYGSTFYGMEVTMVGGKETLLAVSAKKKKGEFIDLEFFHIPSVMEVGKSLPKHQHCFLAINSDKVLIKSIAPGESDLKTVSNAFPGLSHIDFYTEILNTPYCSFVAVCRKDYIHNFIKEMEQQNIHVLGFHLGIIPFQVLVPLFTEENVSVPRYQINIEENVIRDFLLNENFIRKIYELEGVEVESEYLISLAMLFNYTGANIDSFNNFGEKNKSLHKYHQEKVFFQKGVYLVTGLLLASLLINTFFFNAYFKKEQQLSDELVLMESGQKGIESKLIEVNKKEKLVNHILNSDNSKSSYYLNQIVILKPSTIGFSDIQYQPLSRSIRPDKPIEYSQNRIVVTGESKDKADFSEWITKLEELKWQENVSVIHYANFRKGLASFSLIINLKDEPTN